MTMQEQINDAMQNLGGAPRTYDDGLRRAAAHLRDHAEWEEDDACAQLCTDMADEIAELSAAPQPSSEEMLAALRHLEGAASRVSELGAQTGQQWSHLTGAILRARAFIAKASEE